MPTLQFKIFCTLFLLGVLSGFTDDKVTIVAEPESNIWIEGKTSINDFRCEATSFEGAGLLDNRPSSQQKGIVQDELTIKARIPTENLDCGKRRMNRDLYNALKGDRHPNIVFDFIEARKSDYPGEDRFIVTGNLTVAGVTREITFDVNGFPHRGHRWRVVGQADLSMKDFEIDPPSPLMGMIRVDDRLSVNFDIVVILNNNLSRAGNHE